MHNLVFELVWNVYDRKILKFFVETFFVLNEYKKLKKMLLKLVDLLENFYTKVDYVSLSAFKYWFGLGLDFDVCWFFWLECRLAVDLIFLLEAISAGDVLAYIYAEQVNLNCLND